MILTDTILEYIFVNLGMTDQRHNSILSSKFLIDDKITFDDNEQYNVYACQTSIGQAKIIIAGTSFKYEDETQDMTLIVKMENCPIYGCFLTKHKDHVEDGLVAFTLKDKVWLAASVFIQASFLAGMEQLRDVVIPFDVCDKPKEIYEELLSFLKYRDTLDAG